MKQEAADAEERFAVASQLQLTWWRFRRHRLACISGVVVILFYLLACFADFFATMDPHCHSTSSSHGSPTWKMTKLRSGKLAAAPSMSNVRVCSIGCGPSGTPLWTPIRLMPSSCVLEHRVGDPRVVHPPWERLPVVVADVVELQADGAVVLHLVAQQVERLLAFERVDRGPEHRPVRVPGGHVRALLPRREPVVEEVGQRQRLGDDHVRVGLLDDHVVDLVDAPLAEELLARELGLALAVSSVWKAYRCSWKSSPGGPNALPCRS